MSKRLTRISNILRFVAIIVAVASLAFNFWLYREKNQIEEASEAVILHQMGEIADANRKIRAYEAELDRKAELVDSLMQGAEEYSIFRDSLMYEISHLEFIIDRLKTEIDENIVIPDFTDDEHIQLFLEWTDLERYK